MTNITKIKFTKHLLTVFIVVFCFQFQTANAQDATPDSPISAGLDLYSTYVWRGVAYSGPSVQPYLEFSSGGFAIGAWGSQGIDGFQEMDLYTGYTFDFGLSLGITDYYYPGSQFFDDAVHAFELNGAHSLGDLSISGNYIFAGDGAVGDDVYFELGYSAGPADLFIGGGDGWHSTNTEFTIVNIGVGTTKIIEITENFSIPVSGAVILNPDTEQFYITAGLSL
jgi:hypothetical protein